MNHIKAGLLLILCAYTLMANEVPLSNETIAITIAPNASITLKVAYVDKANFLSINIFAEKSDSIKIMTDDVKPAPEVNINSYTIISDDGKKKGAFNIVVTSYSQTTIQFYANAYFLIQDKKTKSIGLKSSVTEKAGQYTLSWNRLSTQTNKSLSYEFVYVLNDSKAKVVTSPYEYLKAESLTLLQLPDSTSIPLLIEGIFNDGGVVFAKSAETGEIIASEKSQPFTICSNIQIASINSINSESSKVFCFAYQASPLLLLNYWTTDKVPPTELNSVIANFYSLNDEQSLEINEVKKVSLGENKLFEIEMYETTKTVVLILNTVSSIQFSFNILLKEKDKNRIEVPLGSEFAFFYTEATSIIGIKVPAKTSGNIRFSVYTDELQLIEYLQLFTVENGNENEVEPKKAGTSYNKLLDSINIYVLKLYCKITTTANKIFRITLRNNDFHIGDSIISYYSTDIINLIASADQNTGLNYTSLTSNLENIKYSVSQKAIEQIKVKDFKSLQVADANQIFISNSATYLLMSGNIKDGSTSFLIKADKPPVPSFDDLINVNHISKENGTPFYKINKQTDYFKDIYVFSSDESNICITQDIPNLSTDTTNCLVLHKTNGQMIKLDISRDQLLDDKDLFVSFIFSTDILTLNIYKSYEQYETISDTNKVSFINLESNQKKIIRVKRDTSKQIILTKINEFGSAEILNDIHSYSKNEFKPDFTAAEKLTNDYYILEVQSPSAIAYLYFSVNAGIDGFNGRLSVLESSALIDATTLNFFVINQINTQINIQANLVVGLNYLIIRSFAEDELTLTIGSAHSSKLTKGALYKGQLTTTDENPINIKLDNNQQIAKPIIILVECYTSNNLGSISDYKSVIAFPKIKIVFKIPAIVKDENKVNLIGIKLNKNTNFTNLTYLLMKGDVYVSNQSFYSLNPSSKQLLVKDTNQSNLLITVKAQSVDSYLIVFIEASKNSPVALSNIEIPESFKINAELSTVNFETLSQALIKIQPAAASTKGVVSTYKSSQKDKCVITNSGKYFYINDQHDAHFTYDDKSNSIVSLYCSSTGSSLKVKSIARINDLYNDSNINSSNTIINYDSSTTEDKNSRRVKLEPEIIYLDGVTGASVTYYSFTYQKSTSDLLNTLHFFANKDKYIEASKDLEFVRSKDIPFNMFVVAQDKTTGLTIKYDIAFVKNADEADGDDSKSDNDFEEEGFKTWKKVLIIIGSILLIGLVIIGVICYRNKKTDDKDAELLN